ncbi:peptidyl-prolyl cis-trans isomerase FKBP16-3 [Pyrus ussuriensis x Pyrus communis]|uniref:peptidylprolyl isomerase n=1 Tax=Pyrus ussuriensis x Pyrus communis TaxID=2448454 RepID=A0A5N5FPT9_9ROSA|nr:peptidyl-prolyl cis-trans isomerase FKBP16-3 [Pyrus ussuriensis x Pyrus communis]
MASSSSTLLLPLGSSSGERMSANCQGVSCDKVQGMLVRCSNSEVTIKATRSRGCKDKLNVIKRREMIGLLFGVSSLVTGTFEAEGAGLPREEKPRLCDNSCEKELENYKDIKVGQGPSPPVGFQIAANYVAMVPSGQIFDSSLEKGQVHIFRVGSGQVIKGLDEGILSMKIGGKRRLYIPGSAPGRPRVAPSSPVVFDVSLECVPGLDIEEE